MPSSDPQCCPRPPTAHLATPLGHHHHPPPHPTPLDIRNSACENETAKQTRFGINQRWSTIYIVGMFVFGSGFVLLKINQRAPITAISKLTNKKTKGKFGFNAYNTLLDHCQMVDQRVTDLSHIETSFSYEQTHVFLTDARIIYSLRYEY